MACKIRSGDETSVLLVMVDLAGQPILHGKEVVLVNGLHVPTLSC